LYLHRSGSLFFVPALPGPGGLRKLGRFLPVSGPRGLRTGLGRLVDLPKAVGHRNCSLRNRESPVSQDYPASSRKVFTFPLEDYPFPEMRISFPSPRALSVVFPRAEGPGFAKTFNSQGLYVDRVFPRTLEKWLLVAPLPSFEFS